MKTFTQSFTKGLTKRFTKRSTIFNKNFTKGLALSLIASLVFVTACSKSEDGGNTKESATPAVVKPADPFGRYDETVTLSLAKAILPEDKSLPTGDTLENNQYTRYVLDKANIKFDYTLTAATGDAFKQKVEVAIASNDIPDVMIVTEKQLRQMVEAGQLEDLTEVYENYATPQMKEVFATSQGKSLEMATFDGKLMAIPNQAPEADFVPLLWIRQDWLDKVGLEQPKTVDDLIKVAKAFIEQDPDDNGKADTIGLPGPNTALNSTDKGFGSIFTSFGAYPKTWLRDSSGNVIYGSIMPEMKDALLKLREMYAAGLIDKEFALRKDAAELIAGGKAGMFFSPWWAPFGGALLDAVKNNPKADWQPVTGPVDANGQFNSVMGPVSNQFLVVKKGIKHPEAALIALNTFSLPDADKLDKNVLPEYVPVRLVATRTDIIADMYQSISKTLAGEIKEEELPDNYKSVLELVKTEQASPKADLGLWGSVHSYMVGGGALAKPYNKVYSLIYSETKTMETKWATLNKLEDETLLKIIMGREPIEAFDTFVEKWKSLGGSDILKEIDAASNN
ncbi:extracellular solute-binding protein [Paenibacillus eucommiae]|uniref:Aldouronate transport system substrate-binding protein n=1 Tax=Paenibacillus eucommiae TaxID=1355755 RepID=A0ABS4J846_9BACL|nr:extracellular solute-binding protein [Paenibacillus eucommiae]MBP1995998.1 putative aldouronate transport system substrate-binding protein [Paenibacillus eucommiae]